MQKTFVLYFTLITSCFATHPLLAEEIKVGYSHLQSLIEEHEGSKNPVGPLVTYWEDMAVEMGVTITWVGPLPGIRLISYLKNKEIDVVSIASKSTLREKIGLFSDKPIFIKQTVICFPQGITIPKLKAWNDLQTLNKIGIIHGHRLTLTLSEKYPALPLAFIQNDNPLIFSLSKLAEGKLDAFIYPDRTEIIKSIKELDLEKKIVVVDAPVSPTGYYALFSSSHTALLEKYNAHHGDVTF